MIGGISGAGSQEAWLSKRSTMAGTGGQGGFGAIIVRASVFETATTCPGRHATPARWMRVPANGQSPCGIRSAAVAFPEASSAPAKFQNTCGTQPESERSASASSVRSRISPPGITIPGRSPSAATSW